MHWNINISLNSLHCILQNMTYLNALITSGSLLASTKMCCITHLTYDIHGLSFLFEPKPIPAFLHFAQLPQIMCSSQRKALRNKVHFMPVSEMYFFYQAQTNPTKSAFSFDNNACCSAFLTSNEEFPFLFHSIH